MFHDNFSKGLLRFTEYLYTGSTYGFEIFTIHSLDNQLSNGSKYDSIRRTVRCTEIFKVESSARLGIPDFILIFIDLFWEASPRGEKQPQLTLMTIMARLPIGLPTAIKGRLAGPRIPAGRHAKSHQIPTFQSFHSADKRMKFDVFFILNFENKAVKKRPPGGRLIEQTQSASRISSIRQGLLLF